MDKAVINQDLFHNVLKQLMLAALNDVVMLNGDVLMLMLLVDVVLKHDVAQLNVNGQGA